MSKIKVGVLGATGAVGQRLVRLLHDHPWFQIAAMAGSERTTGKQFSETVRPAPASYGIISDDVLNMKLLPSEPASFDECRVVFSALPADVARDFEPAMAQAGLAVISNASAYRMGADIPLVVPEVNPDHLKLIDEQRRLRGWSGFIVTNPNCSAISLTLALAPLHRAFGLEQVFVTTLQALSGAGYSGVSGMDIVDNVIPYIGGEEEKLETEPLKLLGDLVDEPDGSRRLEPPPGLKVSAQCTRVPTTDGHVEMVSIKLRQEASAADIWDCWDTWRAAPQELGLPTAPSKPIVLRTEANRPQPRFDRDTEHGMASVVGRLRPCPLLDYKFALLGHNLIRGAAGGVLLIAELLKAEGRV